MHFLLCLWCDRNCSSSTPCLRVPAFFCPTARVFTILWWASSRLSTFRGLVDVYIFHGLTDVRVHVCRGYNEVVTPNLYNMKLWEISGHAAHYRVRINFVCEAHLVLFRWASPIWFHLWLTYTERYVFAGLRRCRVWLEANELPWSLSHVRPQVLLTQRVSCKPT